MIITKHPTTKNKQISKKAKPRHVVVSKKSRKSTAPDGSDASDIENSSEGSVGSTRLFSPIGFLTVFCSAGLETPITASDSVKWKVIEQPRRKLHIEEIVAGTRKPGQIHGASTAEYFMEQVVQLLESELF